MAENNDLPTDFTKFMMGIYKGTPSPQETPLTPVVSHSDPRMKEYMDTFENQKLFWTNSVDMKYNFLIKIGQGTYG